MRPPRRSWELTSAALREISDALLVLAAHTNLSEPVAQQLARVSVEVDALTEFVETSEECEEP